ncbi:MAG: hypothetical protein H6514_14055 [Acidimicrobiaceae bacterium]|nr:hypothetical protein [Acidimicrobiaceae bacterium]
MVDEERSETRRAGCRVRARRSAPEGGRDGEAEGGINVPSGGVFFFPRRRHQMLNSRSSTTPRKIDTTIDQRTVVFQSKIHRSMSVRSPNLEEDHRQHGYDHEPDC